MNEHRDRFLTEYMGFCWHDYDPDKNLNTYSLEAYVCNKCKGFILGNNDFSVEEDFLRLLGWVKKQDNLQQFLASYNENDLLGSDKGNARDGFADRLCATLKGMTA